MRALSLRCAAAAAILSAVARSHPLEDSSLGLNEVAWHGEPSHMYLGSPSLLRLRSGAILATADRFGSGFSGERNVSVYRSTDNGTTWSFVTWVVQQYWSNLFQLDPASDDVYLLGTATDQASPAKIARSRDGGETWMPSDSCEIAAGTPGRYNASGFETGPTPALLASNGRLYRALELFPPPRKWGASYQAVLISADAKADLLDVSSWRVSEPLAFNTSWLPASWGPLENPGFLEGNAVEGPGGEIFNVLRFNSMPQPGNHAVLLQYDEQTNMLEFRSILYLPGGHTKFVIRRDEVTKLYVTLSNNNTVVGDPAYYDQRNVLTLCASPDLVNWTIVGTLLSDDTGFEPPDSVRYTGFHYVDWQADGDDLIYLVRTAYRGAVSYHNSNRITFKRLANFRSYLPGAAAGAASATVRGNGFSVAALADGALAYSNRKYVWTRVPPALLQHPPLGFTQLAGGGNATLTATVTQAGRLFVGNTGVATDILLAAGFVELDAGLMSMAYTDASETTLRLFSRQVAAGETVSVPQGGWAGSVLIGSLSAGGGGGG